MSMKNCNDTSWDRTSDLPICSTAPQPHINYNLIRKIERKNERKEEKRKERGKEIQKRPVNKL